MARGVTAYSLVNATVRALYAKMIEPRTWDALIHAQDLNALLSVLSKTGYDPYLQVKSQAMTPRRAAYQIRWRLAKTYTKIIRLTPEPGQALLLQLWRLYEVNNLKATLRGIETGASWDRVLYLLSPMDKHTTLSLSDMESMVRSGNIRRALNYIAHTPYYDTLIHALERYHVENNLFPLEVALDLAYRRELWKSINNLSGPDHEQAQRIVGTGLDTDNLLWAIRYRIYHKLSKQEIINYTLPYGYRVQDEDIRMIADGNPIAPIIQRLYPDIRVKSDFEDSNDLSKLETALQRHLIKTCRKAFSGYPFHIGTPTAYLWLNEYEIKDLTMLIEAKASHLPIEMFAPLLVMQPTYQQTVGTTKTI